MLLFLSYIFFLSLDESDSLDDESDELGSDTRSSGTYYFCAFSLYFENSAVSVSVLGIYSFFTNMSQVQRWSTP